ncbi:hypothetical protein KMW28_23835 [Flammeovirga yaeyamensis]|uniref:Outer membrane protein beta-barrel domain-containing protein n=1 Tax=Flammeovirga yaeyamensis TaxID=367791 RepID=A0AAX1NG28_9BACT|nr:hypothetical protein [Flammeovirga yaeyamensis]MBB3696592.1 hypothetical protein [Flammeovirga yaeyamensis]NMF33268.1 hypothetical protein [Flammeovirga yaeyamensis]QWG05453.1 hypothetical protein KMW28_23835 [Flammeovirga yaeyamensis]
MKKIVLSLLFIMAMISTSSAQKARRYFYANQPTGITFGADVLEEAQFKVSAYSHYVYFSFSSNFKSTDGTTEGYKSEEVASAGLQNKGSFGITQYNLGAMLPLKIDYTYGIYIAPQGAYARKFDIYENTTKKFKGPVSNEYGAAVDFMYIDRTGITFQAGVSALYGGENETVYLSGLNIGVGYSF